MPNLVRPAMREVRSRIFDSARWAGYQPRPDDIVIATYPKCGTTWTQRIVAMMVNASADPAPIASPWFDMRLFGPIEGALAEAEAQTHRRYLKTHLPYDALPVYEGVKFIHVARDGRDSAMSFHNHLIGTRAEAIENFEAISLADPKFGTPWPDTPADPAAYFTDWLDDGGGAVGDPGASFFEMENSYWAARRDPNMLMVHYNDLKADRDGEMRRIARFLGIDIPAAVWPSIVEGAGFEAMRAQGETLMPYAGQVWDQGSQRFLNKGTNGRWQGVVSDADLARYDAMVKAEFSPALAAWLEHGRLKTGDPALAPD